MRNYIIAANIGALMCSSSHGVEKQKNILFIAVDDLRPTLGCYGDTFIRTPNIDRLAQTGIVCERAYVQLALCGPSRASLMTGLRPDTIKVWDNRVLFRETTPGCTTIGEHFKRNGYFTKAVGKVFHHDKAHQDDASWSDPEVLYFSASPLDDYHLQSNLDAWAKAGDSEAARLSSVPPYERADVPDAEYKDAKIAQQAILEMQKLSKQNEPFFLAVGFHKPHLPYCAPAKYWDMYSAADIPETPVPNLPENFPNGFESKSEYTRLYKNQPAKGPFPPEEVRNLRHGYFACVSFMDAQVGRLLDELDRLGIRENTVVVLWGDNGFMLNDHGIFDKHNNFELAVRVPLIVSVPGYPAGRKTESLIELIDVFPTLCDISGIPIPERLEGTSFKQQLVNPDNNSGKQAAFSQYPRKFPNGMWGMGYTVRTKRYRYTEWRKNGSVYGSELYDYDADPYEKVNQAANPEYAPVQAELAHILTQFLNKQTKSRQD